MNDSRSPGSQRAAGTPAASRFSSDGSSAIKCLRSSGGRSATGRLRDAPPALAIARVFDRHATIGELVAFNVYVVMLIWPLRMLGQIVAQWQRAIASSQRVADRFEIVTRIFHCWPVDGWAVRSARPQGRFSDTGEGS